MKSTLISPNFSSGVKKERMRQHFKEPSSIIFMIIIKILLIETVLKDI